MSISGLDWQSLAVCGSPGVRDLFFGPWGEPPAARNAREAEAKAVCARCPVRRPCLSFAVSEAMGSGVWGGMSEDELRLARRRWLRRQRGYENGRAA